MYQSVEEPQDRPAEDKSEQAARRVWRVAGMAALVLVLMTLLIALMQSRSRGAGDTKVSETERGTYHSAITERTKALRRARLQDYVERYPDSPQRKAASAQLDVLISAETKDWSQLAEAVYNPEATQDEKQTAIKGYEREWAASYLGGREDELTRLRNLIGDDDAPAPDRDLPIEIDIIPDTIDGSTMAGGPVIIAPPPVIIAPATPPVIFTPVAPKTPRITKNAKPKYPSRALRKNIQATVQLSLSINTEGKVETVELVSVTAEKYEKDFVKAAKRAAKRTRYEPYIVNGLPQSLSGISKRYQFKITQEN